MQGQYLQVNIIQNKLKDLTHLNYYVALSYTHLNTQLSLQNMKVVR